MKTSNLKNILKNVLPVFSLAIVIMLFLASCQKEEAPSPGFGQSDAAVDQQRQIAPTPRPFAMIQIDHQSGRSTLPDYSVTVNSDRTVIFEGRRNVATKGKVEFNISAETFIKLQDIFKSGQFFAIKDDLHINPDLPQVLTTYHPTTLVRPQTRVDNARNFPAPLIQIREKTESVLGISRYVYDDWPVGQH